MCWTWFKTIGHSSKSLGPSQKTLRPTWRLKLVTGLVRIPDKYAKIRRNLWIQFCQQFINFEQKSTSEILGPLFFCLSFKQAMLQSSHTCFVFLWLTSNITCLIFWWKHSKVLVTFSHSTSSSWICTSGHSYWSSTSSALLYIDTKSNIVLDLSTSVGLAVIRFGTISS